ncbi:MAG: hypothetical protein PHS53_00700 [Candidatus Pacebacteria bacterium]|nr:hypothetical protein [Candidatus Paceibacterota bacterium]MDD5356656.1 hypothetical protein [Candidatus Paceibacterota bacterium]
MLNQSVLRLQKYVMDMGNKPLGKGFTLNLRESRTFAYSRNAFMLDMDGDDDDASSKDDEEEKKK